MQKSELAVGQIVTVGTEVEFWGNPDETKLEWRTDRWCKWEITNLTELGPDYATIELKCMDGVCADTVELDLDYDDIELAK
jgi:hypothetical protein